MDDFEDGISNWDELKNKAKELLLSNPHKEKKQNITLGEKTNVTMPNKTVANITEEEKFTRVVKGVIKGYEKMIDISEREVEGKKQKMQKHIEKLNKDVTVMKQQIIDADTQIKEMIKNIETSQESINKQETSLKVFYEQLKKNDNETDLKLKDQVEKDLRKTITNAQKQKKQSQKQQGKFIIDLRRLYRQKKRLMADVKAREEQIKEMTSRLSKINELTSLKVKDMRGVVSWMNKKLELRKNYTERIVQITKSINETLPLLESEFTTAAKKAELTESINQMKKLRVHLRRQIKIIRFMLGARVAVYNKNKVVRIAYESRRDRLAAEEKKFRNESYKLTKIISQLRLKIKKQTIHLKKQTVEVLKDISAAKLSELNGELAGNDSQMRKVQRKLSLLDKAQKRARKDYDEDLRKIAIEFQKTKMAAFKKARKEAIRDRKRLERRIIRLEKAMTDTKFTPEQIKGFSEKAATLRKRMPEANLKVKKAIERIVKEEKKTRLERAKEFKVMEELAKKLREKEDALANEQSVLREKISQTTNQLEKSGLIEDLNDVVRRLASVHSRAEVANRAVEKIEYKKLAYLKSDFRGEKKLIRILMASKERVLKRIAVLKNHNEYNAIVNELQHRVEEISRQIEGRKKIAADLESKVTEQTRKINDELKLNIVAVKSKLDRLRARKEEISDVLNRILKSSKKDSVSELQHNAKRMRQMKKELVVIKDEETRVRAKMDQMNKVLFLRNLDEKTEQAARKSRKLIATMKKSSRKVRKLRARLVRNKRLINKLYRSAHETGDIISERAEDKMEQLKNVRAVLKNKLKKLLYEHKKIQVSLMKHVERVKRLSKFRIHHFHKRHAELLKKRNELMKKKAQVKKDKGTEYYYTQIDLLDEKMNEVLREEAMYKKRIQKKIKKMVSIAKECEKKTPAGLEGIKVKCTMCRNLAAFLLQKIRRDRLSRKEAMKKMYNRCEKSVDPSLCLRTALKLSTQAFQKENKDLTPKELCYKIGRCVLKV